MIKPREGVNAWTPWLATFSVGEERYHETTLETYARDRESAVGNRGPSRAKELRGKKFSVTLWTAVGSRGIGGIRYLLCVERTV